MDGKNNLTVLGFTIDALKLEPVGVLEIFREEFGDWDIQESLENIINLEDMERELKLEGFDREKWSTVTGYQWLISGVIIFFIKTSEGFEIHWDGYGYFIRKRIQKVLKKAKLQDQIWFIRKLLWGYTEPERVKRIDTYFKLKLEISGVILAGFTLFLGIFNFDFAWISSLGVILITIIWGIYRYGISINAIDLRVLSIASFYWLILQGFPISLVSIFVALNSAIFEGILSSFVLIILLLKITQRLLKGYIYRHLLRTWSEIRRDIKDEKRKTKPNIPTKETNLAKVAILQYSKGYIVSLTIIMSNFLFTFVWISFGFSWVLYITTMVFLIALFKALWTVELYCGLATAKEVIEKSGPYQITIGNAHAVISTHGYKKK